MAKCTVCGKGMLSEWPHAHTQAERDHYEAMDKLIRDTFALQEQQKHMVWPSDIKKKGKRIYVDAPVEDSDG